MAQQEKPTPFFERLRKLFSTKVIVKRDEETGKTKVVDHEQGQQLSNLKSLKDRFYRLQTGYKYENFTTQLSYSTIRRELFLDYDAMDNDPIIASALDIYADECLGGETVIPMLDGTKRTISELYEEGATDFWVYGLNEEGDFVPVKVEKVAHNGKKSVRKITLEDDTEIFATDDHIWVNGNRELVKTKDLKEGDGLYTLSTRISDGKSMGGYEQIETTDKKYEFTHRIVGSSVPDLVEQKSKLEKPVLHHASFDKRNNDPSKLVYMEWEEHIKLHREYNIKLWEDRSLNPEKVEKMIEAVKEGHRKYWTDELKEKVGLRQKKFMMDFTAALTEEERNAKYGRPGDKNGMYGKGYKLAGENNGRWRTDIDHANSLDLNKVVHILYTQYKSGKDNAKKILADNGIKLNGQQFIILCNKICDLYGITTIKQLKRRINSLNNNGLTTELKQAVLTYDKNPLRNYSRLCETIGTTVDVMNDVLYEKGYRNFSEFVSSTNHRIKSISTEYTEMDVYDLVNAGTNHIYAIETRDGGKLFTHNCTTKNEYGDILTIRSTNQEIKEVLHNLFYDILNVEFNLWPWTRNLCKYGDLFLVLEIVEGEGVVNVHPQSVYHVTRTEGPYDPSRVNKKEPGIKFTIDPDYLGKHEYDNYEMAHFRLYSDTNYLPYGKAMIENARRLWKQITLMEDAMMIHRIMRAPEKRIFKIDIGNIPPQEVDNYMQKIITKIKKTPFVDPNTGDYNLKYNMMNITEDFFMPVRGGDSGTSIDTLNGLQYAAIEDLDYLKAKMFAALKIPKAFIGYDENVNGKATLAAEDVRFARTIERIQRVIISELTQIALVHLIANGYEGMEAVDFELELTNPSTIYEQEKVNLWAEKVRLATDLKGLKLLSSDWIYDNIFRMSKEERDKHRQGVVMDTFDTNRLTKIENEGVDPYEKPAEPQPGEAGAEAGGEGEAEQPLAEDELTPQAAKASAENGKLGGRPRELGNRGTDDNAFGRDPLGNKENQFKVSKETRRARLLNKLKGISGKEKVLKDAIRTRLRDNRGQSRRTLLEGEDLSGSLLDDRNILPEE